MRLPVSTSLCNDELEGVVVQNLSYDAILPISKNCSTNSLTIDLQTGTIQPANCKAPVTSDCDVTSDAASSKDADDNHSVPASKPFEISSHTDSASKDVGSTCVNSTSTGSTTTLYPETSSQHTKHSIHHNFLSNREEVGSGDINSNLPTAITIELLSLLRK